MFKIRKATTADIPAITEIYNEAILTTTATFDTQPRTMQEQTEWLAGHDANHPVLVTTQDNKVIAWASLSEWSSR